MQRKDIKVRSSTGGEFDCYLVTPDGGGKILHGPSQVPGGGWIVQASDPQGASFALVGSRKQ